MINAQMVCMLRSEYARFAVPIVRRVVQSLCALLATVLISFTIASVLLNAQQVNTMCPIFAKIVQVVA